MKFGRFCFENPVRFEFFRRTRSLPVQVASRLRAAVSRLTRQWPTS